MTPSGTRGALNDPLSIYFVDATLANAFVARWCVGAGVEATGGVFQVREDEPVPRLGATMHREPAPPPKVYAPSRATAAVRRHRRGG
jgi:hypothetical protein